MRFRIAKTEVELSYTLLCLAAISVILGVFRGFLWCAAAIAVHEGGHLLMMLKCGYFPKRIKVLPFSIAITDRQRQERGARENLLIIFFGPFANFICFLPSFLLYLIGTEGALPFAAANCSVGLFNLLPVMSLDGGQLAYILLCKGLSADRAERAVDALTFVFIFPLAALGFWLTLRARNVSLLFVSVYLVLSLIFKGNRYY